MNDIFPWLFFVIDLGRPHTAKVRRTDGSEDFFRKIDKVSSLPHSQTLAAGTVDYLPVDIIIFIVSVSYTFIGGEYYEAEVSSEDFYIKATLEAFFGSEYGQTAVNLFPVEAVTADSKINLFSVGSDFFFEVSE